MLAAERHNAIVALVNAQGSALVKDLSRQFGVTEDCIRKDLTQLEKKGLLEKTYGGAMRIRMIAHDYMVENRIEKYVEEKKIIARKAFDLIEENDIVFLDMTTSNIELAKLVSESGRKITVITNMIEVMRICLDAASVKLIFIGGVPSEKKEGFVGSLSDRQISCYTFDKAFIGVVGVDVDKDRVTTYIPEDGETKRCIIKHSLKRYMMLETRKLHEDGAYLYAGLHDFDGLIIEKDPNEVTEFPKRSLLI